MDRPTSAYIHIPFCDHICSYCDFVKVYKKTAWEGPYMEALLSDIADAKLKNLKTIYVGGGTPSCLDDGLFRSLLIALSPCLAKEGEFTVEANPESLSREKIRSMKEFGVNRVSMGLESANPAFLSLLGRKHDFASVQTAVASLKEEGIANINVDLIYGLPGETLEDLDNDIEAILSLSVPHLSTYSLILEKGTKLYNDGFEEADQETLALQYERILSLLRQKGYRRYEVSNFALPGFESRHNLVYWKDEPYFAFGIGASGYEEGVRYKITPSMPLFLKGIRRVEEEKVSKEDDVSYYLLTNLRLEEGFLLSEFASRFGFDLREKKKEALSKHILFKNLLLEGDRLRCSDRGLLRLDSILVDLI